MPAHDRAWLRVIRTTAVGSADTSRRSCRTGRAASRRTARAGSRAAMLAAAAHVVVVEEDREQPHVVARRFDSPRRSRCGSAAAARWRDIGPPSSLMSLNGLDLLRLAVLGDLEVVRLQIGDRVAVLVGDDHVDADEVDAGAEDRRLAAGRRLVGGCAAGPLAARCGAGAAERAAPAPGRERDSRRQQDGSKTATCMTH